MPSYRNCIIFLLSLIFLLRLSKPASSLFATRYCRSCKGGLSKKAVVVGGRSSWVMPTQSTQRMQTLLLRATKHCHYCAGFTKRRVSMIRNQPPLQSFSLTTTSSSSASSSSALFGASPENIMDEANYNNNINECSTTTTTSMHHLRKQQLGEEEQPHTNQHSQQQEQQQHYRPLVIVLAGPTAVGKSDVASLLCTTTMARDILEKHFANYNHCHLSSSSSTTTTTTTTTTKLLNRTCVVSGNPSTTTSTSSDNSTIIRGHIISADSVQVYRANIDIGSNKPSAEELLKTPYHLVGIVDPPNTTTKIVTSTTTTALAETATSTTTSHTTTIPTVLDAKLTAAPTSSSTTTSTTTSPPSASVYGAADWMNDVMHVLRSLPMMNNHSTSHNTEQLVKNDEVDHHRSERNGINNDGSATTNNDNLALIQRREYIDRDLNHNLVASSSTTIDNETNTIKNNEQTSTHPSNSPSASSSLSSPLIILPVVTGGTMMYLQWLVHGRPDAVRPTEEAVARAADTINTFRKGRNTLHYGEDVDDENVELLSNNDNGRDETKTAKDDDASHDASCWEAASTYVSSLGPVFAKRVEKLPGRDWYRLRRLLEVAYTMSLTKKRKEKRKANDDVNNNYSTVMAEDVHSENELLRQLTENEIYTGIRSGSLAENGYDVRCFFLCPTDRMAHFHAVDMRCEEMLLRGLLRECADLYVTGVLQTESQVSRAIGYRQTLEYLTRAGAKSNDGPALLAFVDDFSTATRQYAKKQMQWFRREKDFAFIPVNMDEEKDVRVEMTAQLIADMCKLYPIDYDSELSLETKKKNESGDTLEGPGGNKGLMLQTQSLSTQTRLENERQGKGMKFFLSKRVYLVDGSDEFMKVMAEADECTRLVQGLHENF